MELNIGYSSRRDWG